MENLQADDTKFTFLVPMLKKSLMKTYKTEQLLDLRRIKIYSRSHVR